MSKVPLYVSQSGFELRVSGFLGCRVAGSRFLSNALGIAWSGFRDAGFEVSGFEDSRIGRSEGLRVGGSCVW